MDTILILTIVVIFTIIIISIYINRSRNAKKKQITDVIVPPINDIPSLEVIQAPENIDSIIQPIDDNVVEPKDIEPTVKVIRYIKTTGQDEYYREKLLNQNWKVKVEKIKNRDGYQCQHCFGLTLLDNIDEIKNYVDYPEVGDAVIDIFKSKELYYKPSSHEYEVLSYQSYENLTFSRLEDTDLFSNSGKIDLVSTSPLNEENIYGISKFIDIDSSFRYNVREPAKTTKSIGIIYFVDGNTNNQLVLRNIEWYKPGLPYAKQGILTFNGLTIVFPLLSIKKEYLDVHHKAYYEDLEPWECPDNELITLCHRCHMKAHEQEIPVKRIIST